MELGVGRNKYQDVLACLVVHPRFKFTFLLGGIPINYKTEAYDIKTIYNFLLVTREILGALLGLNYSTDNQSLKS